ncbi:hypothetical protein PYCCODRAFT_1197143 [Trametes coccinea BRFM310]|uniref:Uncharacterized protein n=1 Tax=Trametes coccinea (strain BRFM310) TaxID=1353009 RepID=A0A1Y2IAX1_TRAC3|nr:hypothetical protein PYCCODRAFT_1197143 [Trametes coccinea BRFM310]
MKRLRWVHGVHVGRDRGGRDDNWDRNSSYCPGFDQPDPDRWTYRAEDDKCRERCCDRVMGILKRPVLLVRRYCQGKTTKTSDQDLHPLSPARSCRICAFISLRHVGDTDWRSSTRATMSMARCVSF